MREKFNEHQRFSLRKYKAIGLASVFLGTSFLLMNAKTNTVKADTVNGNANTQTSVKSPQAQQQEQTQQQIAAQKPAQVVKTVQPEINTSGANQTAVKTQQTNQGQQNVQAVQHTAGSNTQTTQINVKPKTAINTTVDVSKPAVNQIEAQKANQNAATRRNAMLYGTSKANTNVPTSGNSESTDNINVIVKYGNADDLKKTGADKAGFAVDTANENKQISNDSFSVGIKYHYNYDSNTNQTAFTNISPDMTKVPSHFNPKYGIITPQDKSKPSYPGIIFNNINYYKDAYNPNADPEHQSNDFKRDFDKWGAFIETVSSEYPDNPTYQNASGGGAGNLIAQVPENGTAQKGAPQSKKPLGDHNITETVYLFKRPLQVFINYKDNQGRAIDKNGINTNKDYKGTLAGTFYYDQPVTITPTSPNNNYVLTDENKSPITIKFNDTGSGSIETTIPSGTTQLKIGDFDGQNSNGSFIAYATMPIEDKTVNLDHNSTIPNGAKNTDSSDLTKADFQKTVYQQITAQEPSGSKDESRSVVLYRTGVYDYATGKISKWNPFQTGTMPAAIVPSVSGYTANPAAIPAETINDNTGTILTDKTKAPSSLPQAIKDQINASGTVAYLAPITISYTQNKADEITKSYQFVDDDNSEAPVGSPIAETGTAGQTITLNLTVPAHYKLADGQTLPTTWKVDSKDTATVDIHLTHIKDNITGPKDNGEKDNNGNTITDENGNAINVAREAVRTITVVGTDGNKKITTQVNEHPFTRQAYRDEVTGKVTYGDWSATSVTLPEFDTPAVSGYTPSVSKVNAVTVNVNDPGYTWSDKYGMYVKTLDVPTITYTKNAPTQSTVTVHYTNGGSDVGTQPVKGNNGSSVPFTPQYPAGYEPHDPASVPKTITIDPNNPNVTIPVDAVTTVHYTDPSGKDVGTQPVKGNNGAAVPFTPNYPNGYHPTDPTKVPKTITVIPGGSVTIPVTQDVTDTIHYLDPDNKPQGMQSISGKPGTNVDPSQLKPPAGWKVDPSQSTTIPFDGNSHNVHIVHNTIPVNPGQVPDPGSTIKGDGGHKTPGDGKPARDITYDDLHKTVSDTITVTFPEGHVPTNDEIAKYGLTKNSDGTYSLIKSVTLTRNGTIDDVTGSVTYSPWQGSSKYDDAALPGIKDYTPVGKDASGKNIALVANSDGTYTLPGQSIDTANPADTKTSISYITNAISETITFEDGDNNDAVIGQPKTIKGDKDSQMSVALPDGYVQKDAKGNIPSYDKDHNTISITIDGKPQTIILYHGHTTVTSPAKKGQVIQGDQKNPYAQDITDDDLTGKADETVTITLPDGSTRDVAAHMKETRGAIVDQVTGKIIDYTPWVPDKPNFPDIVIPAQDGYTPNVTGPDGKPIKGITKNSDGNWVIPGQPITITKDNPTGSEHLDVGFTKDNNSGSGENGDSGDNGNSAGNNTGSHANNTGNTAKPNTNKGKGNNKGKNNSGKSGIESELSNINNALRHISGQIALLSGNGSGSGLASGENQNANTGLSNNSLGNNTYTENNAGSGNANCSEIVNANSSSGQELEAVPAAESAGFGGGIAAPVSESSNIANASALPQTGQKQDLGLAAVGLVLVSLALANGAYMSKHKRA